ncbi:MAG TPA: hypothetical protein VN519_02030 [Bryobacteraceae bacterium]|nr:hypothetical protein [Bryobacteraceae bacterium]
MRNGYPIIATVMPAALLLWGAYDAALGVPAVSPETDRVVDQMIRQQEARFDRIGSFSRLQRYSVTTDRFGLKADLLARVHRDRQQGKTYEIISRSGSQVIQSHVFDPLLEAEVETSHHAQELLTREYYSFRLTGEATFNGHRCYLLETQPKEHEKWLLKGKLWLNKEDFGIIHVEGKPSESLSFWVGKPMIIQDFTKLGDYWWAARRHSYIDKLWLGKADLVIDYSDYRFEPRRAEDITEAQAAAASTP